MVDAEFRWRRLAKKHQEQHRIVSTIPGYRDGGGIEMDRVLGAVGSLYRSRGLLQMQCGTNKSPHWGYQALNGAVKTRSGTGDGNTIPAILE